MLHPLAHRVRFGLLPALLLLGTLFSLPKPLTAAGPPSFAAPVELTPTGSRHNTWRDLNQDGRLDLVTGANRGIAFYLRRPDGGFDPPQVHIVNPEDPSGEVGRHVVADFNDDGYPDCLAHVGLRQHYLQNDGNGRFALFREIIETVWDNSEFHQIPFDFDGDGRRDIIGQKEPNEEVFVLRNRGNFQFDRVATGIQTKISSVPDMELVTGAFNGDRDQDLCTTLIIETGGKRSNNVYSGNGLGKFSLIGILGNEGTPHGYDVGDLNNDGNTDIVSNKSRGSPADGDGDAYVLIHYGNGEGGFTASEFMYDDESRGPIRIGDLDLDGWNDLVVLSYSLKFNGLIWVGYDHKMNLFINDRNGGFIRKTILRQPGAPWWADDLQIMDFDGDTAPDILMKSAFSGGDPYVFFRNLTPPRETSETAISRWTGNRTGEDANSEFHGEVNGAVQYSPGIHNEAFEFTSPGGGVRISDDEDLVGSPSFTVGAWVNAKAYPTSPAAPAVVYVRGSDSPVVVPLTLRLESDKRIWFRTECHTDREGISAPLSLNRWTHVAGVFDAGRKLLRLYYDGVLVAERTIAFLPSRALGDANRPAICIGNHSGYPLGPLDWPFRGLIDDVHFFDRALTPVEMGQLAGILPTSPPDAPVGLKVMTESDVSLRLSWEDRSFNEKRFEIERRDPGGAFFSLIGVPANTTSYLNTNLQPSTTYTYRVRAVNDIGASGYCAEASATTLISVWPAPSNLEASSFNARKVGLFWDDNTADETSFSLERSLDGTRFTVIKTLSANTVEIFDATTLPNTKYWYRLRGVRGTLVSSYSNLAIITTPPDPPLAPANLSATPLAGERIRLDWEDRSNIETRFRVERGIGDGSFDEVTQLAANTRTWTTGALDSNRTFFFRVRAQNTGGFSAYANTAKA